MRRIRFGTVADVYEAFPALAKIVPPSDGERPPLDFVERLIRADRLDDALAFMAFLLPRREVVWWGCRCLMAAGDVVEGADKRSWALAANWARSPDEQRRIAALDHGDTADDSRAATWLTRAAAWSGGTMVVNEYSATLPPPDLTAKSIRAALSISLGTHGEIAAKLRRDFLAMGLEIARADSDLADDLAAFQKKMVAAG
ncbi:hypothetical protein EYW49_13355 [Siculibacillus lacustris]|uniref:Uncharacterized protein n=1 Tax=Siculibacillus lacustris TaxID=1549641 RepID=A0A4Q9VM24_9HYPH|nr:hypothetical protein [Siculibacillus lacustris]TBW36581.1 hypothetical protein EYW49_13355 [Siculibacillus lacustris]